MTFTRFFFGLVKIAALLVGGFLTFVALMALVGMFSKNGWIQIGVASVVALVLPALVADKVLPAGAKTSDGLVSDVYAIIWTGIAVAAVAANSFTGDVLRDNAKHFDQKGKPKLAALTKWIAGPKPVEVSVPTPAPQNDAKEIVSDNEKSSVEVNPSEDATKAANTKDAGTEPTESSTDSPKRVFTPAELFKELSPAVVTITVHGSRGMGGGTGFVIDASGIVVTNHHVIDKSNSVSVKLLEGKWASKVELLVQDKDQDLAILKITTDEDLHALHLGDSDLIQVGERAISIGNPLGLEHTLTDGLVSARRTYEGQKMIQMSTPVSPGNSGGPLFNLHGEVIGVTTAQLGSYSRGQNLNLAVPINQAKAMLSDDYPERKRIGGGSPTGKGSW